MLAAALLFLAQEVASDPGISGGQIAGIMALTNLFTGAAVAFGAWWIAYRKEKAAIQEKLEQQQQGFRKENREQDRLDRDAAVKEWERLV
jgi:hypothetical protein